MQNRCLPASFAQYTSCTAHFAVPFMAADGSTGYSPGANAVPVCEDNAPTAPCYTVTADAAPCATGEYLVQTAGADALAPGTMLELTCE